MQRQAGFTLIELLITMVVLAVLAAIAIPSYTDYIRRGKLAEATSNLQAMKVKMEQYFQDNRSYPGACVTTTPGAGQIQIPTLQYFTLSCDQLAQQTYRVTATGGVGGGDQSLLGIAYTINQANVRTTTVTSGTTMGKAGYTTPSANCWVTKKPALC
jgi:type IV pilus assembly protein PilE